MNKDVIYIESEDDITDVITKIEKAKEKIVAVVPPKKAGVFRSIVNIKLIAKAGAAAGKTVVLVTVDPSIMKLAAATRLPVAKSLQSAPVIPPMDVPAGEPGAEAETIIAPTESSEAESVAESTTEESTEEESSTTESTAEAKEDTAEEDPASTKEEKDEGDDESDKSEKSDKKSKKDKEEKKPGHWFKKHKIALIIGSLLSIGLIVFVVWAFVFAPKVDITVAIKTEAKNFSEGITLTDNLASEKAAEGVIYLEQRKYDSTQEVSFQATGQKNLGEKAKGELIIYTYFKDSGTIAIPAGSIFTINGLNFTSDANATLGWSGPEKDVQLEECENNTKASILQYGCLVSGKVTVTAANGGTQYNVGKSDSWTTTANVLVRSDKPTSGGTDNTMTVVQQSDVNAAQSQITASKEAENKKALYETIGDDEYIIESTFSQTTANAQVTPGVDEEVKAGVTPSLKVTTTASVFVISKTKLEEFIRKKAAIEDGQKIYQISNIYLESLVKTEGGYTARLKAQYYVGANLTDEDVVRESMGKGLGEVKTIIKSKSSSITDVEVKGSYPWVNSVPNDKNKISVSIEVKDQDGNKVDPNAKNTDKSDTSDKTDNAESPAEKKE
ncbi:hypothetical protein IKE72_01085 [Candidatus Saccharibacteria bacterium]|nr:hypothetical protein [Candidatus Saccharibacteria bacterium]